MTLYDYVFPYHLFHRGERIAIYGAGTIGKSFYQQVKIYGYVQVVAIVDKNANSIHEPDIHVGQIETLRQFDFESVLISMTNEKWAREARELLHSLGIADERIRWAGSIYRRDDFYKNYLFKRLDFLTELRKSKI